MTLASEPVMYSVIEDDKGKWLHPQGGSFIFAYIDKSWPADVIKEVGNAYKQALQVANKIKEAIFETTGEKVHGTFYILNENAMANAMNTISGMSLTSVTDDGKSGEGTAADINQEFFTAILGGLSGDIAPISKFIKNEMVKFQGELKNSQHAATFGSVFGLVSVVTDIWVVETDFQYVFSHDKTADWLVSVSCSSVERQTYNYQYTVADYNYSPES